MGDGKTILVVEDERRLAGLLRDYLAQAGYEPHLLHDGTEVVPWVRGHAPDLVLLDLMLPGRDGMEIAKEIRVFSPVPIVMTTARVEEIDRLLGLELGADDYICKPYSPREVVARVKAVLRRAGAAGTPVSAPLLLDPDRCRATFEGRTPDLTAVEFHLLRILASQPGRIFSRGQLMDRIYPDRRIVGDRTIDSHVKKLRRKIADSGVEGEWVHSVYGVGYKFEPPEKE